MSTSPTSEPTGAPELSPARQWAALAVLMSGVLVISIDNTVLGFAVPALSADLRPSATELLWIVDAYAFVLAGLLITMGNLGDRIGRRRLLLTGAAGFALASTVAAFATSPTMLIAARALLGVAGATLMPSTLSLIRTIFPDPARRRVAIGVWTSGFAVGAALGPIVGGWMLEHLWWGSVFLLAVPVMGVLLVAGPFLLPESRNDAPGPFDPRSSLLSFGAVLPVVYAMKQTAEEGPTLGLAALALVGAAVGVVFIRRQQRLAEPMLDVTLFEHRPFATAIVTNLLSNFAFVGAIFLVAQYLQLVLDLGPLAAGFHLLPGMAAAFVASLGAAALLRWASPGSIIAAGLTATSLGFLVLLLLDGAADGHWITLGMAFVAFGASGASSLGANLVMAIVPARRAGSASAVSETAFELGAAVGIAVLGSLTSAVYRRRIDLDDLGLGAAADRAADTLAEATEVSADLAPAVANDVLAAAHDAFAAGLRSAGLLAAVLMLGGAVLAHRSLRSTRPTGVASTAEPAAGTAAT